MTLKQRLNQDLHDAMRRNDERRKSTLRMALAAIRNAEIVPAEDVPEGIGDDAAVQAIPRRDLDDAAVIRVLQREVKQRRDSIDQFRKASRQDLVEKEEAEVAILQAYLPQQMSREEIAAEARQVIGDTGAAGPGDKNKVMPVLMRRLAGKAEGRTINEVVTELLGGR